MSVSTRYQRISFPEALSQFNSAVMEVNVTVTNPADTTKKSNLLMQFDTGAACSLGPRSVATVLGLDWASGIPLSLSGVGGAPFTTYVHVLDAEIPVATSLIDTSRFANRPLTLFRSMVQQSSQQKADAVRFKMPIAITEGEDFDLLLGMLGVVDGVAEFLCDNMNATFYMKEYPTQRSVVSPLENFRWRLQNLRT